jgi:hypothetical protein
MNILNRPFGCEIEISTDFDEVRPILRDAVKKVYKKPLLYAKNSSFDSCIKTNKWHLKDDTTTMSEICTPISTFKDMNNICKVAKSLIQNDVKITNSDSFHVHVSASDVDPKNILACWLQYESVIKECFPKRRRKGDYCTELIDYRGKSKKNIAQFLIQAIEDSECHFSIMSFTHYAKRKTVEFRISEGTLNPEHIRNWVKFCLYFVNYSKRVDPLMLVCDSVNNKTLNEMILEMGIKDQKLIQWLRKRNN